MKKRQFKLLASVVSLTLVLAIMAVGVLAAANVGVTVSNTVTYTAAKHVRATLTSNITANGTNTTLTGGGQKTKSINESSVASETFALGEVSLSVKTAQGPTDTVSIKHVFKITNDAVEASTNKYLSVAITDTKLIPANGVAANGITYAYDGEGTASKTMVLHPGKTLTMTIIATYNVNIDVNVDLGFSIALESQSSAT